MYILVAFAASANLQTTPLKCNHIAVNVAPERHNKNARVIARFTRSGD